MKKILKRILSAFGYDTVPRGLFTITTRQINNIIYQHEMFEKASNIEGAIVECGIGKGRTFLYLTTFTAQEGKQRRVWGFDSFEGFPEPSTEDMTARQPKRGEWGGVSPEDIVHLLKTAGVPEEFVDERVRLVKGFVENTLSQYDGKPIALLHIDLDLYEAYRVSLERLVPFVAKNGLVLFDEYGHGRWPGATKAVDEYLKDKSWLLEKHPSSGKFFFRKK